MSELKKRESLKSPDYYYTPNSKNVGKIAPIGGKTNGVSKPAAINGGSNNLKPTAAAANGKNSYPYAQNNNTNNNSTSRERSYANSNDDDDYEKTPGRRTPRPLSRTNSNVRQMSPDTIEIERLKAQINQEEQLRFDPSLHSLDHLTKQP